MGVDPVQHALCFMKTRSPSACPSTLLALLVVILGQPRAVLHAETLVAASLTPDAVREAILAQPWQPAAMLLFTMNDKGANAQEWHGKVGRHYGLPMVSFRDALWPEILSGRRKWEDVEADQVHPHDRGHALCASFIAAALDDALQHLPPKDALLRSGTCRSRPATRQAQAEVDDRYNRTRSFSEDAHHDQPAAFPGLPRRRRRDGGMVEPIAGAGEAPIPSAR